MDSAEKRMKSCTKSTGKSDCMPFTDRTEYYNLSWFI